MDGGDIRTDVGASSDELALLIETVTDYAIFLLDPEGRIRTWNRGAERIKGYTAQEIIGAHFSRFYTPEDQARGHPDHELRVAVRDGRYEEEGWRVRKDGTRFWANAIITPLRGQDGELVGFGKVTRDLTARREAQEALRAANEQLRRSNEELDRFASVAAHDLSDPLRTVSGFAELLAHQELPAEAAAYVGHIVATAERMSRLLADLLEYARAGEAALSAEPVSLCEAAGRVMAMLAAAVGARGAEVVEDLPEAAVVLALHGDVELVLQNLIANALKFGAATPHVEVAAAPVDGGWRLTVVDNGPGIAPADQERIFAPFERAHPELSRGGTGLGLAICQRLVRRHGGQLGVESEPGQGATFWVLLPAAVATA